MPGAQKKSLGGQKNGGQGDHRQRGKSDIFVTFLAIPLFLDATAPDLRYHSNGFGSLPYHQWVLASFCHRTTVGDASLSQYLGELCRRCVPRLVGPRSRVYHCAVDRIAAGISVSAL